MVKQRLGTLGLDRQLTKVSLEKIPHLAVNLKLLQFFSLHGDGLIALAYMEMGLPISLKMHFFHSHQCFLENLDAVTIRVNKIQGMEARYQRFSKKNQSWYCLLDVASW